MMLGHVKNKLSPMIFKFTGSLKSTQAIHWVVFLLTSSLIMSLFYFRYLFLFHGYAGFINYVTPLNVSDLKWTIFFDPSHYDTVLNTTPESTFFQGFILNLPWYFLNLFVSSETVIRSYVVLTSVFYMGTAYWFSGEFSKRFDIRLIGSTFLMLNPFMLMLLVSGDNLGFVTQGFVVISLTFLIRSVRSASGPLNVNWLFSVCFLAFSIIGYQTFFLGTGLYIFTLFLFSFEFSFSSNLLSSIKRFMFYLVISLGLLVLLVLPDIYPLYASGLTSSFIFSPGLASFTANSVPVTDVLILKGYPPNIAWSSAQLLGNLVYSIWSLMEISLIILLFFFPFVFRNSRYIAVSFLVVIFSFVGAGADSFFSPLTSFLYLHFPGYQSLNGSYFWDWFLSILYGMLLLQVLERTLILTKKRNVTTKQGRKIRHFSLCRLRKYTYPFTVGLVVFVLIIPLVSQRYYNSQNGINDNWGTSMPASYSKIGTILEKLLRNSSGGVAYFNPDVLLYFNNTSKHFPNPYLTFPQFRTAEITTYGSPHTTPNRYFYWVYTKFYLNETRYLGPLMGLAGIQFFVVLNGTNSWSFAQSLIPASQGKNANLLMSYQFGVKKCYIGNGFVIYRNLNYTGTVNGASNLTIVSGGYNELNDMLYYGWNTSSSAIIMSTDVTSSNYRTLLENTRYIVVPGLNGLWGIVLRGIGSPIDLSGYARGTSASNSWTSTYSVPQSEFYLFNAVNPSAVVYGKATMPIPAKITRPGNYTIWFQLYHSTLASTAGGSLAISVGNLTKTFVTLSGPDGITNSFIWEKVDTYLYPGESISFSSISGWNALRNAIIVPTGLAQKAFVSFNNTVKYLHIKIIQLSSGRILSANASQQQAQQISRLDSSKFPDGLSFFIGNLPGYADSMNFFPVRSNGTLYISMLHWGFSGGLLNITVNNKSTTFGFSALDFSSQENSTTFIVAVPLRDANGFVHISTKFPEFLVYIQGITFVPEHITMNNSTTVPGDARMLHFESSNSNLTYRDIISNSSFVDHTLSLSTSILYNGSVPNQLSIPYVLLTYNLSINYNFSVAESLTITPGFYLYYNSVYLGDTNNSTVYFSSGGYGTNYRNSLLNVALYPYKRISNVTSIFVSFSLKLSFFASRLDYGFTSPHQLISEQNVTYGSTGYTFPRTSYITILRLPFYQQTTALGGNITRFSIDSSVNQLIFSSNTKNIHIIVTYSVIVMELLYLDAAIVSSLLALICLLTIRRKRRVKWFVYSS